MQTQDFGFARLLTHVVGDMAKAVSERNGETREQQFLRSQAAVHAIMGFLPRDVIEAVLAGRCVMFHELIVDSVRETLRGELDTMRRGTRGNIVAMDRAFGNNLTRLEHYQTRPSEGRRDLPEQPATAEPPARPAAEVPTPKPAGPAPATASPETSPILGNRAARRHAARTNRAPVPTQTVPASRPTASLGDTPLHRGQSEAAIAACQANPEAMAALDAGDALGFARAMGIDAPAEAFLAAATDPGSVFRSRAPEPAPLADEQVQDGPRAMAPV